MPSKFCLSPDYYNIFIGCITNRQYLRKLESIVKPLTYLHENEEEGEEEKNFDFNMIETNDTQCFLEYIIFDNNKSIEKLIDDRRHYFVNEDYFNPVLFESVKAKASLKKLKAVCRRYEMQKGSNVDHIMTYYEKRTLLSTPYFLNKGLSTEDAQAAALSLSFYTGTEVNVSELNPGFVANNVNQETVPEKSQYEIIEASVILYYLANALSYIPYYWGYAARACQLTDDELRLYMPGCLITWIQYSSAKRGKDISIRGNFPRRNTFFKIRSLTGRSIKEFSIYPEEDDVLFLPNSMFFVIKHITCHHGQQHVIYMKQVELGLSQCSVLWVDDRIFNENWKYKLYTESAATRGLNMNVHFIPKLSTESALSFLQSVFGQRLKKQDTFRIVTTMNRETKTLDHNIGIDLIKNLRQLGYRNRCLVLTNNLKKDQMFIQSELSPIEQVSVYLTAQPDDIEKFINFE
jgi:hypothetical protein